MPDQYLRVTKISITAFSNFTIPMYTFLLSNCYRHERYTHPDIVLKFNASLMGINKRFAIFSISEKDVDVYSHTVGPFFYNNQFNHCTHLIRIPLEFFSQLGEQIGDPPPTTKFVLLSNTGRCGSTLLTQLFEEMPNTTAISEPEVLMEFSHNKTFDEFPTAQRYLLLKSCIRLLFKLTSQQTKKTEKPNDRIDCFLIKPKAHGISVSEELANLYPNMKHLYMYRHPAEYVRSVRSVYKSLLHPIVRQLMMVMSFSMNMNEFIMRQFGAKNDDQENAYIRKMTNALDNLDVDNNLEQRFAALFCANMLSLMKISSNGGNMGIRVVSYHELKDNTHADMNRIRKFCEMEITPEKADNDNDDDESVVIRLPENDSQNNSGLSRNKLRSHQTTLKDREISIVDEVLELCGFPSCDKFPLDSENLSDILGILKPSVCAAVQCYNNIHDNGLSVSRYKTEACLKAGNAKSGSSKALNIISFNSNIPEKNTPRPNRQTTFITNKSLWLPVNRFF